jgi:hypothetical protein
MKASELRIGSIITDEFYDSFKKIIITESLNDKGINLSIENSDDYPELQRHWIDPYYTFNELQGVPLTEEWLVKFGFVRSEKIKHGNGQDWQPEYPRTDYVIFTLRDFQVIYETMIYISKEEKPGDLITCDPDMSIHHHGDYVYGQKPEYVHQLQNLYFVLTGEELTLQSEKK